MHQSGWIDVSEWKKPSQRRAAELRDVDHPRHPAGRVGQPLDIGKLAAFLLSADAGFVTGQNFVVDGRMMGKMLYEQCFIGSLSSQSDSIAHVSWFTWFVPKRLALESGSSGRCGVVFCSQKAFSLIKD